MYAAVPRSTPAPVISDGDVIVGEWVGRRGRGGGRLQCPSQTEIEHFDGAVLAHFDVRGLQIAMDDPLLVRRLQRVGNLPRDRQRLIERYGALCNPVGQGGPFNQLQHQGADAVGFFQAVNGGDVRMVQRGEHLRFASEPRNAILVGDKEFRQALIATSRSSLVSRAR
jgi:hypothetical protein